MLRWIFFLLAFYYLKEFNPTPTAAAAVVKCFTEQGDLLNKNNQRSTKLYLTASVICYLFQTP